MSSRHCVVLAGGLGTRIRTVTKGRIPKVLVPVLNRPFLKYKLESLYEMGVDRVTILVGEKGDLVDQFLKTFELPGFTCTTFHDGPLLLGTAGSIRRVISELPERFWVTYGDSYVVADMDAAEVRMNELGLSAVMTVLKNEDQLEQSNTNVQSNLITEYRKGAPLGSFDWIDYGLLYLPKYSFDHLADGEPSDLFDVLHKLIVTRQVLAHEVFERFWDVGTPESLVFTESEFARRGWGDR